MIGRLRDLASDLRYRLRALLWPGAMDRELDEELRFHLQRDAERLVAQGLTPEAARRQALLAFGPVEALKESSRDARGVRLLQSLARDLAHGFRRAAAQPGFTAVVGLSLALGVGATTAAFNLTYNLLFAPLAVPHPEDLVALGHRDRDGGGITFTWDEFRALRETPGVGRFATARTASAIGVASGEHRVLVTLHFVDGDYFGLAGVRPARGRLLTSQDDERRLPVVVLSQWFAEQLFPGDTVVVGRTILIRGVGFTVVGVTPRSFRGLEYPGWFRAAVPEGAVPLLGGSGRDDRGEPFGGRDARLSERRTFLIYARRAMAPEPTRLALTRAFERCCRAVESERLEIIDIRRGLPAGKGDIRPQARLILALLLGGMGLVLVVVCSNVASLLLVRGMSRQRELAVRLALGAPRPRLAAQLAIESVPHALIGGLGGLAFAAWYTAYFIRHSPLDWSGSAVVAAILGFRLGPGLGVATALTALCGLAFALYPALRVTGASPASSLRLDARASRSRGQGLVARSVVLAQVAVTLVLISAAALVNATVGHLLRVDGGYATDQTLLATIEARSSPFEGEGLVSVQHDIARRVRAVPGIRTATLATLVPLFGGSNWPVRLHETAVAPTGAEAPWVWLAGTLPGFFEAAGIALEAGRDFTEGDGPATGNVAIVNQAFARRHLRGAGALDRSVGLGLGGDDAPMAVRIVGIARDAIYDGLRAVPEPMVYVPLAQMPGQRESLVLLARTAGLPAALGPAATRAIEAAAPGVTVRRVTDMASERAEALTLERLAWRLTSFVSVMALLLAAVGVYGVVAFGVSRRRTEIGVRMALGARVPAVLWLVARETLGLVGVGVVLGVPLSLAGGGLLRSQLYGVSPYDPRAALVGAALLGAAGVAASVLPAWRATRIDPRIALNAD